MKLVLLTLVIALGVGIDAAVDEKTAAIMVKICDADLSAALDEACKKKTVTYLLEHGTMDDKQMHKHQHKEHHHRDRGYDHDHNHDHDHGNDHNDDQKHNHSHEHNHDHDGHDDHDDHEEEGKKDDESIMEKCCYKPCTVKDFIAFCGDD